MLWVLRAVVGALWLVAAAWKAVRFYDLRIFVASLAGVPYGSVGRTVVALGIVEGTLGVLCVTGLAAPTIATASLASVLTLALGKALWPRRGGSRPPCSCLPWVPRRPAAGVRAAAAAYALLPDIPLLLASAALWTATLHRW